MPASLATASLATASLVTDDLVAPSLMTARRFQGSRSMGFIAEEGGGCRVAKDG